MIEAIDGRGFFDRSCGAVGSVLIMIDHRSIGRECKVDTVISRGSMDGTFHDHNGFSRDGVLPHHFQRVFCKTKAIALWNLVTVISFALGFGTDELTGIETTKIDTRIHR